MKHLYLTKEASWFIDKILFRSKYMNILTRSSIELVSPSVYSGTSCPTTQCFLFFRSGFHMAIESLYFYRKTLLKFIQTILETYFTGASIDLLPTAYKLSKNNRVDVSTLDIYNTANKERGQINLLLLLPYIPALSDGDFSAMSVKINIKH